MNLRKTLVVAALAALAAQAAVPPDIAKKLVELGRGVCVGETAALYNPLQPEKDKYPGVKVVRDQQYGNDKTMLVDVFYPEKGGGKRPVLIYIAGGGGTKIELPSNGVEGGHFYDNIMLWAVKNGMVGVNVQRRQNQIDGQPNPNISREWDAAAKDIGTMVQWVQANVAKYKGNPDRLFTWSHSAGNPPTGTYLGRPELWGPKGVGIKGAVLMGPAPFNIAPAVVPPAEQIPNDPNCGRGARGGRGGPGGPGGGPGAAKGGDGKGGAPGGDGKAAFKGGPGGGGGGRGQVDPAVQLQRSTLPGLAKSKVSFFLSYGELDIVATVPFVKTLADELTKLGSKPTVVVFKDHSHVSEVFSPYTADESVTAPILKWMKSVK